MKSPAVHPRSLALLSVVVLACSTLFAACRDKGQKEGAANDLRRVVADQTWVRTKLDWVIDTLRDGDGLHVSVWCPFKAVYLSREGACKIIQFIAYKDPNSDTVIAGAEPSRDIYHGTWTPCESNSEIAIRFRCTYRDIPEMHEQIPGPYQRDTLCVVRLKSRIELSLGGETFATNVPMDANTVREITAVPLNEDAPDSDSSER